MTHKTKEPIAGSQEGNGNIFPPLRVTVLDSGAEVRGTVVDQHRGIVVDQGNGAVEDLDHWAMAGLETRAEAKTTMAGSKQMTTTEEPVGQVTRAELVTKMKPANHKSTTGQEAIAEQRHGETTWP